MCSCAVELDGFAIRVWSPLVIDVCSRIVTIAPPCSPASSKKSCKTRRSHCSLSSSKHELCPISPRWEQGREHIDCQHSRATAHTIRAERSRNRGSDDLFCASRVHTVM